jgi:hypothetical protein
MGGKVLPLVGALNEAPPLPAAASPFPLSGQRSDALCRPATGTGWLPATVVDRSLISRASRPRPPPLPARENSRPRLFL